MTAGMYLGAIAGKAIAMLHGFTAMYVNVTNATDSHGSSSYSFELLPSGVDYCASLACLVEKTVHPLFVLVHGLTSIAVTLFGSVW